MKISELRPGMTVRYIGQLRDEHVVILADENDPSQPLIERGKVIVRGRRVSELAVVPGALHPIDQDDDRCTWCRRTRADHKGVAHAFALRCTSTFDTQRGPVPTISCMRETEHDGKHENGTWRW